MNGKIGLNVGRCLGNNQKKFSFTQVHHKWKYRKTF